MKTAADLANLEDATITVRNVNQLKEGRKNATLKDDDDNLCCWLRHWNYHCSRPAPPTRSNST